MAKITLDFSQIPDNDLIPEGTYPAVVEKVELRTSNTTGSQYLNWTFQMVDADHLNRKVFAMTSLVPKALWKLRDFVTGLGDTLEAVREIEVDGSGVVINPAWAGRPVLALIKIEAARDGYPARNHVDGLQDPTLSGDTEGVDQAPRLL